VTIKKYFKDYLARFSIWLIWDFSGLRFVYSKIRPAKPDSKKPPPATICIWIIGVYVAFFGVASQRYENRLDKIENRANAIFTQLATPIYKKALSRVSRVQNMPCPQKPRIRNPISVFRSLFGEETRYDIMVELLKETIEDWKNSLDSVNLAEADLQEADLSGANLKKAKIAEANLYKAILEEADLAEADLRGADLRGANLSHANLVKANLSHANLCNAIFIEVNLKGAFFNDANLQTIPTSAYKPLGEVNTLHRAKLPPDLEVNLRKNHPELFPDQLSPSAPKYLQFY